MREFNATLDHSVGVKLTMCRLLYTAIITLAACAYQHPALKRGSDYQVSAEASTARGGIDSARQLALSDANKKCTSMGKNVDVTHIQDGRDDPAAERTIVNFRCT